MLLSHLQCLPIFGEKIAFFSKTRVMIKFLQKLYRSSCKKAKFFGENIFKFLTSVPGAEVVDVETATEEPEPELTRGKKRKRTESEGSGSDWEDVFHSRCPFYFPTFFCLIFGKRSIYPKNNQYKFIRVSWTIIVLELRYFKAIKDHYYKLRFGLIMFCP
jgi:hypothetical protein